MADLDPGPAFRCAPSVDARDGQDGFVLGQRGEMVSGEAEWRAGLAFDDQPVARALRAALDAGLGGGPVDGEALGSGVGSSRGEEREWGEGAHRLADGDEHEESAGGEDRG